MAVTIEQIAEAAGVSRGTVDRVLHNRGRVNPEVAKRVKGVANELGYVLKGRKSTEASTGEPVKIGLITQLAKAPFMVEINRGIREEQAILEQRGICLISRQIDSVEEEEQLKAIDDLAGMGIQGLAIMPVDSLAVRLRLRRLTEEAMIPVVTFNSDIVGAGRSCFVGLDNRKSGTVAAGLMGMLTGGAGEVLVITGFFSNNVNSARVDGFLDELRTSFPGLEVVGVQGSFDDAGEVEKIISKATETYPDLAGILLVCSGQEGIKKGLRNYEENNRRPYIIVYDLTQQNAELLKQGNVDFIIDQEGYEQGFRSLEILANMLQRGEQPAKEFFFTDINIKTKYNI